MTRTSLCPPTTVPTVLIALATALLLTDIATSGPPEVRARPCARAVMLDGYLRCDEEAPPTIAELCTPDHRLAGQQIIAGDRIDEQRLCDGDEGALARMTTLDLRRLAVPIDVNHAPVDELRSLPGIGPVLAERIVAARPYESAHDLDRVRGIGPKTIQKLRPRLLVR